VLFPKTATSRSITQTKALWRVVDRVGASSPAASAAAEEGIEVEEGTPEDGAGRRKGNRSQKKQRCQKAKNR